MKGCQVLGDSRPAGLTGSGGNSWDNYPFGERGRGKEGSNKIVSATGKASYWANADAVSRITRLLSRWQKGQEERLMRPSLDEVMGLSE